MTVNRLARNTTGNTNNTNIPKFSRSHSLPLLRYIVINTWNYLLKRLKKDLPEQEFNTWIRPLQGTQEKNVLCLLAPNAHVLNLVKSKYSEKLHDYLSDIDHEENLSIKFEIGSTTQESLSLAPQNQINEHAPKTASYLSKPHESKSQQGSINTNKDFTFTSFVEGKSNQLARAAGIQVGENPGLAYNPLFIYGGVGLGKTHLMHAVGNMIKEGDDKADVLYMHSENFVASMVKALQHGTIDEFKRKMRNVNALLIDDVQFFAGKERSQEEFFHTFNALFESRQQIILTSDRFPKEVEGLEDRLKSRFGWGLTVAIEPPDLETRVAILMNKSKQLCEVELPTDVAFFIAKNVRSNIRELEGALRRISANAKFTGETVNVEFAKEALRDMIDAQAKLVTLENIQKTVSEYFKIRISDMRSNKRSRTIARPRQIAMALAKDLTNHSLPEIGEAFGGRDHTTVLYATRKVSELRDSDPRISEDYNNLLRTLNN